MKSNPIKVFICYARKDIAHRKELDTVLKPIKGIDSWSDSEIRPGSKWKDEIRNKLNDCHLFLYLLSMHSRGSDTCNEELTIALQKVSPVIIPIYVEPCDWETDKLIAELEMLPQKNGNLLAVADPGWERPGSAWAEVSRGIQKTVDYMLEQRKPTGDGKPENETGERSSAADERSEEADWNQARLVERSRLFLLLGQFDQAIDYLNEVLKLKPDNFIALGNRGAVYLRKGKFDQAIADFDEMLKLKPSDFKVLFSRGFTYFRKGEFDRAIADLNEVLKLKPDDFDALFSRGDAHLKKGEIDRAIADFDEALKLKPDNLGVLLNRGIAYARKDEFDRAITNFDKALKLKPDSFGALFSRGLAYASKDDRGRAITDLEQALRVKPDSPEALALLVRLKGS